MKLLLALCFLGITNGYAQWYTSENKVWAFGNYAGLDFNTTPPTSISTKIHQIEGCASISDSAGHLLFYTDGDSVFKSTGGCMLSGAGIVSFITYSTTQAAVIIPWPGHPNQYYVFSLETTGASLSACKMAYSIVDMTLDSGDGDVLSTARGVPMGTRFGEKMTAIPGNNCDAWLVTHRLDSPAFWSYHITASGISTPVISVLGGFAAFYDYAMGGIKASHDATKLVMQSFHVGTELFDFDATTGIVSNARLIDSTYHPYTAEFSPNNKVLYSVVLDSVLQFDISLPTTAAIAASKTVVAYCSPAYPGSDMKLAPDGKIYTVYSAHAMSCITSPDLPGIACGYIDSAMALAVGTAGLLGLPNAVVVPRTHAGSLTCPDSICISSLPYTLSSSVAGGTWMSKTGNTTITGNVITAGVPGVDTLVYIVTNACGSDTATHPIRVSSCPTGIGISAAVGNISLYPNPAGDELVIAGEHICDVIITDVLGQQMLHDYFPGSNKATLEVSALPPGVYIARVNGLCAQLFVKR